MPAPVTPTPRPCGRTESWGLWYTSQALRTSGVSKDYDSQNAQGSGGQRRGGFSLRGRLRFLAPQFRLVTHPHAGPAPGAQARGRAGSLYPCDEAYPRVRGPGREDRQRISLAGAGSLTHGGQQRIEAERARMLGARLAGWECRNPLGR